MVSVLLQENSARPVEPEVTAEEVAVAVVEAILDEDVVDADAPSLMPPLLTFSVVLLLFCDSPTPSPTPRPIARARRIAPMMIHIRRFRLPA